MAFGREWGNIWELTLKNNGDAEKMLELYIYDHMKKKNLHDVVKVFAKEANIETYRLLEIEGNLLTEWWEVFWPVFCSSQSNEVEVIAQSRGQVRNVTEENERAPEAMLHLYIYHYLKKREFLRSAKFFVEEANIEVSAVLENAESFLKDWWEVFWTRFLPRVTKQPEGNAQSSAQPSVGQAQEMLFSLKRSQQNVSNVVGQPPEVMLQAPQQMSQRRADKRPMNFEASGMLGHSASKDKGKGPIGFPPVNLLPTEFTPVPYSGNFSFQQMPGTNQSPPQVVGAYPAEKDSAYPPVPFFAGESYRKNQGSLSGVGVNEAYGTSRERHAPPTFLEFIRQAAAEAAARWGTWGTGDDGQIHPLTNPDSTK